MDAHRPPSPAGRTPIGWVVVALGACAHPPPQSQTLEVRVESAAPGGIGPLSCQARNGAGTWAFSAPGEVTVVPALEPLHITCQAPAGLHVQPSVTASTTPSARDRAREDALTGAKVGAGAGVALGVAAAPVMGGPFAVVLAVGAALKGGEIGGLVGALRGQGHPRYPSPLILRVQSDGRAGEP